MSIPNEGEYYGFRYAMDAYNKQDVDVGVLLGLKKKFSVHVEDAYCRGVSKACEVLIEIKRTDSKE